MVFNRTLCQSSETSRIDVYIIVKDEEFQQCDNPLQYWIIKWTKKKIHWFITKNIFPKNTILHNYATIHITICYSDDTRSKWTLCDLWVVSIRNWIAPWEKCHDIVFINEAEKSEGGILLLHNQLKKLFAAK